ncbi:MAG: 50S ribosomal protein L24 [Verrucomicrobiales bacterium]
MSQKKTHVRKGDLVQVIAGNHKGAEGVIREIIAKKDQVIVEGVRMIKKHARRSQDRPDGGIIEREGPIHISNVKLIEKKTKDAGKKKGK